MKQQQEDLGVASSGSIPDTKAKPLSPLPWTRMPEVIAAYIQSEQDEDYACHAANAYPKLVYELKRLCVSIPAQLGSNARFDNALLRELGELE